MENLREGEVSETGIVLLGFDVLQIHRVIVA